MESRQAAVMPDMSTMYDTESSSDRLLRKCKEAPFLAAGIGGALIGLAYGAIKFRNRGQLSTSLYLIHMRIAAQGAIVSAITLGVTYTMLRDHVFNTDKVKNNNV